MRSPLDRGYVTQIYKATHRAHDKGWSSLRIVDPVIYAYDDGVVIESTFTVLGGNVIAVRHTSVGSNYRISRYVHLKSRMVKVGDKVHAKQPIGIGGSTGNSTGPHLHFEIWVCPNVYVYKGVTNAARDAYAVDPFKNVFLVNEDVKGGYMSLRFEPAKQTTATTSSAIVHLRDKAGKSGMSYGFALKDVPYICVGVTGVIDDYQWLILWDAKNMRTVYSAANFWTIKTPVETVFVEVIKEVEKPVDVAFVQDGLSINIQSVPK